MANLGAHPQPTAPWRPLMFRVHCVVTQRWMKIRVPFAWYWYGSDECGTPEIESGTIANPNPTPPVDNRPRIGRGQPLPGEEAPQPLESLELPPYRTPKYEAMEDDEDYEG